jgi:hypothetical protein
MKPSSKERSEYEEHLRLEAEKFKLTAEDLSNLFDLFFMVDTPSEIDMDFRKTLKMNNMDKWFYDFQDRIEEAVLDYDKKNS